MSKGAVTLDRIAELVSLHKATVSRILMGTYTGREATKQRVFQAAASLKYSPNIFARAIHRKRMPLVLAVGTMEPFTTAYLRRLQWQLSERGIGLMVVSARDALPSLVDQFMPACVALFGPNTQSQWEFLLERKETIAINFDAQAALSCYQVRNDFEKGFVELTRRLTALGHRRFAFLSQIWKAPRVGHACLTDARIRGVRKALEESRGAVCDVVPMNATSQHDLMAGLRTLLGAARRPTALLCDNDAMACACLLALPRMGLRVPEDASVAGCDGIGVLGDRQFLCSVEVNHEDIATCMRQWVCDEILPAERKGVEPVPQARMFECRLVTGETTGQAPVA